MTNHDQYPTQGPPEARILDPAEAQQGLYLGPDESVVADLPVVTVLRPQELSSGQIIQGQISAELRFGGQSEYTTARVISYSDGAKRYDLLDVTSSNPDDPTGFTLPLTPGQKWGIGRNFEGQHNLSPKVSGDHCEVGLDDQGRLEVVNHRPSNLTGLRTF